MSRVQKFVLALILLPVLLVAGVATSLWVTMPRAPHPESLPSQALGETPADFSAAVTEGRALARRLTSEEKLPGLSLAVAVDGRIVWAEGFRNPDLEDSTAITPATKFRIGGVSQCITAVAVGRLVESGQLDLDQPVQRWVPEFPEKQWPVHLRELMAHTSGLRAHKGEGGLFQGAPCETGSDRLALFADLPLQSPPGTEYRYSTYGWILAGEAIAGAAREPYLDFVRREILDPLGLHDTVADHPGASIPDTAPFYYPRLALEPKYGLQECPDTDLSCYLPAMGFLSTPSDLVRLGAALLDGRALRPETFRELQRPVRLESGEFTGHALGWTVKGLPLGEEGATTRLIGQNLGEVSRRAPLSASTTPGQIAGGTTSLVLVPDFGLSIAVASNVTSARTVPVLAERLADVFARGEGR